MAQLNPKIKAATLMESLIAMVIMVVCMGIASMIYVNILNSDKQRQELKAMLLLNQEAIQTKTNKMFLDEEKQVNDWLIKKTVTHYEQTENLYILTLTITNKEGNTIAKRNELIAVE